MGMVRAAAEGFGALPFDAGCPDGGEDDADDGAVVVDYHDVVAVVEPARAGPLVVEDGDDEVSEA